MMMMSKDGRWENLRFSHLKKLIWDVWATDDPDKPSWWITWSSSETTSLDAGRTSTVLHYPVAGAHGEHSSYSQRLCPLCVLLTVAMITAIMMMMTVMVMSISRLVGGKSLMVGFKRQCRARRDTPLLWHVTLKTDYLLFHFSVFHYIDSLLSLHFRELFTGDSLSDFVCLHHGHSLTFVIFPSVIILLYLSTLLHLHPLLWSLSSSLPSYTCSAPPWGNCLKLGFHFYDYNRGQNAYASRILPACGMMATPGREGQIMPQQVEKITSRL